MTEALNFEKSRYPTFAILQIVKSPHLNDKSSGFDEIWYTTAHFELDGSQSGNWLLSYSQKLLLKPRASAI